MKKNKLHQSLKRTVHTIKIACSRLLDALVVVSLAFLFGALVCWIWNPSMAQVYKNIIETCVVVLAGVFLAGSIGAYDSLS